MLIQRSVVIIFILGSLLSSCTSKILKHDDQVLLAPNQEFDQVVKIEPSDEVLPTTPTKPLVTMPETPPQKQKLEKLTKSKKESVKKSKTKATPSVSIEKPLKHLPELEDSEGFEEGRRPLFDPFFIGEEVVLQIRYFAMTAGEITFRTKNFAQVNGRKAYSMVAELSTSSFFSHVYTVDDHVESFMDYFNLVPIAYSLHVKESGQIREAKSYFDFEKNRAQFWEKKVTEKNGIEERKLDWEILPYSQNIFSTFYYLRLFKWTIGKEYSFRVAHDNENLIFKAKALRKEVIDTDIGPMNTIVIQPQILIKGLFKPVGDIFIWLSDDDRKYILKLESKIKIGTIKANVISIKPGTKP